MLTNITRTVSHKIWTKRNMKDSLTSSVATSLQTAYAISTLKTCPFCQWAFQRLANHFPHCRTRGEASYEHLLSKKMLMKWTGSWMAKQRCMQCGKSFKRLDTHLQRSATCNNSNKRQESIVSSSPVSPHLEVRTIFSLPTLTVAIFITAIFIAANYVLAPWNTRDPPAAEKRRGLEANEYFETTLQACVSGNSDVETINKIICDQVFDYLQLIMVLAYLALPPGIFKRNIFYTIGSWNDSGRPKSAPCVNCDRPREKGYPLRLSGPSKVPI